MVSFRTFRRPLFPKPVSCPGLFFAASYCKIALDSRGPKLGKYVLNNNEWKQKLPAGQVVPVL